MQPENVIAAVTHSNPYPFYTSLLAERPIYRDDALGCWVVSSAPAVEAVFASPACRVRPPGELVPRPLVGSEAGQIFAELVRMNDGEKHRRLRAEAEAAIARFTPEVVAEHARHLARVLCTREETAAVLGDLLPVYTLARCLGVPESDLSQVTGDVRTFVRGVAGTGDPALAAARLLERFASPRTIGLLMQSYDATAGWIGNALLARAAHAARPGPQPLDALLDETLRDDPPVHNTRRWATEELHLGEATIAPGEMILLVLAAANRDPRATRVYTFGASTHRCPGTALAKTIAAAALDQLRDLPVRMNVPVRYRPSVNVRIPLLVSAE